jgi:dephospho-CoA kinase
MIRIAIVGSIGSGKTFISNLFGYPVFNADESVSKIYSNNNKIFYKLKKRLPKFFTSPPIKKEELIKAILKNKNNLNIISKIVHPEVRKDLQKFIKKHNKKKAIVLDIPLLLENKLNKKKDVIIFVKSPNTEVLKRLKKRKNFNNLVFQKLKKIQLSPDIKKRYSHYIIKNNFKKDSVRKNVKDILNKIL